jgi:porin
MARGGLAARNFDAARWARPHPACPLALLLVLGALALQPTTVVAQTVEQEGDRVPGIPEPSITVNFPPWFGDPGGIRSALGRRGVTYAVNYIGETFGNPTGGFAQGTFYDGRLEVAVTVDLEKAIGWDGLTFFVNAYDIHGRSITANNLGALMTVSFIEALPSTRFFELWLDQKVLDDRLSFRFGQLSADSEFIVSDSAGAFLNATWGWPAIAGVNLPDGGPAYPLAAPAGRLAFNPNDQLSLLMGVFSGDPADDCPEGLPQVCNPHGLDFNFSSPLLMAEMGIRYNQGEGELAGTLKLGGWKLYGTFEAQATGNAGLPIGLQPVPGVLDEHDRALYIMLDQMIYRLPGDGDPKGITVFGRLIGAPSEGNMIDHFWGTGMVFDGMWSARPHDILGIGFAYTGVSSQIIDYNREQRFPVIPNFEGLLEVSYTAQIMPGLTVQPDFQYFWNPGGHSADPENPYVPTPNAAVFGVRSTINY